MSNKQRCAWIEVIPEDKAEGLLRELYEKEWDKQHNLVDNILKVHSLHPETLRAHVDLYRTVMYGRSVITRPEREMIGVVVSSLNHCHYWVAHHAAGLVRLTKNAPLAQALKSDYTKADVTPRQRAMLDYAVKLTLTPGAVREADVLALRAQALSDRDILDVNQVVAYFAYVNRVADGLGVVTDDYAEQENAAL